MALTLRGTPIISVQGTATQDVTIANPPTGTTLGDLMLAMVEVRTGTVTAAPPGWNLIASQPTASESYYIYWKFGTTNEAGPYVWTTSATVRHAATIISYQAGTGDWDTTNPIQTVSNVPYTTNDVNVIASSITTSNNNANVFVFAGVYDSAQTQTMTPPTAPTTFTEVVRAGTVTERCQIQVSRAVISTAGATGNLTTTLSVAVTTKHAFAVALNPMANVPILTTEAVTSITNVSAIGNGTVTSDNGSAVTAKGVCWSTSPNPTLANSFAASGQTGLGSYTANITGLLGNTLYYVRAYATNANGTGYGNEVTFSTSASVTTQPVTSITETTAIGNATSLPDNGVPITERGVCWSTSPNPTKANSFAAADTAGVGAYTVNITGLTPGTLYYVRGYTVNANGTSYGATDVTFTSSAPTSHFIKCSIILDKLSPGNWWASVSNPGIFIDCTFVGGGGHALRLTTPGTYSFSGNTFTGFGADGSDGAAILNDSGGLVTLNIINGGSTPTYKNIGASITVVNNARTLLLTGLNAGSRVAIISTNGTPLNYEDDIEIAGTTNSGTTFQYDYNYTGTPVIVNIKVIHPSSGLIEFNNISLGANGVELPIQPQTDRQYNNPA